MINLRRVFGISSDIYDHLFYLDENTIFYPAGNNLILANVESNIQKFIPLPECIDGITALSVSADKHLFAVGGKTPKPVICVYDMHNFRARRELTPPNSSLAPKEFISLSFSADSKYLAAQTSKPDWSLHFYSWEKGKVLASICSTPSTNQTVKLIAINPSDASEVVSIGQGFVTYYRYSESSLLPFFVEMPDTDYTCHLWTQVDKSIVGSSDGRLFVLKNYAAIQVIEMMRDIPFSCIHLMKQLVVVGGAPGAIHIFEPDINDTLKEKEKIALPDIESHAVKMASSPNEGAILVETSTNHIHKLTFSEFDIAKQETLKFEHFTNGFHFGPISGLDICIRKPIIITCSQDKSVRICNYLTGKVEIVKYFGEEIYSIALHPSGLYALVGFADKLRLYNILMDDLRPVREFNVRICREFSNGGHLFAAANGNIVQLYSTWTFENLENFKGHNGKVRSLYWTPDDATLVSAGSDGAVYTWKILSQKRENEHIMKSCVYNCAVSSHSGRNVYAVGNDRMIKEIFESSVTKELDAGIILTQLAISTSGTMMFIGTTKGTIRAIRFPLGESGDFQEHPAHAKSVTKIRVSYDDQYLFSVAEDGCLYVFRISDRDDPRMKKDRTMIFADELLITKSDLEEKNVTTLELQRSLEELKLEHEYQLRLKDMNFNEKLKEVNEKYSQEIEGLKISTSILRTEKEKEEVKFHEQFHNLKSVQLQELHAVEMKYNQQLMLEYDKFKNEQDATNLLQQGWQKQLKDFELATQISLTQQHATFETKLQSKTQETQRLLDDMRQQEQEFEEMSKQNQNDADTEILNVVSKYEKRMRTEREECARLKGENGIMKKKFNTLNKDLEDNKAEIQRMKETAKKLDVIIGNLEKEIVGLRKEMSDRDEHIQDKEKKVYDMKRRNQELEKYKFVLDFHIKELKEQVEPRENEIAEMSKKIQTINEELNQISKVKSEKLKEINLIATELGSTKENSVSEHIKAQKVSRYVKSFKSDLEQVILYYQDTAALKKMITNFFGKYHQESITAGGIDGRIKSEYSNQNDVLKAQISSLQKTSSQNTDLFRKENLKNMQKNQELMS